jgi:hypothetical protein
MSHEGVTGADELVQALESVSSYAWEEVAMKVVDILSRNIVLCVSLWDTFLLLRLSFGHSPQPFQLDSIRACNTTFPQISSEDRLYVDQKSFFANINQVIYNTLLYRLDLCVLRQGQACETFQALYSQVQDIELSSGSDLSHRKTTAVTICLSSPPLVGDSAMTPPENEQPITLEFELQSHDVKRFLSALHSRRLVNLIFPTERSKLQTHSHPLV